MRGAPAPSAERTFLLQPERKTRRDDEPQLETVARGRREKLELALDGVALLHALLVEPQRRLERPGARRRERDQREQRKRRRDRRGLGPAERQRGDDADRGHPQRGPKPRRRVPGHVVSDVESDTCALSRSSAAGVGTCSSSSATTSSPRICCSHSSGRERQPVRERGHRDRLHVLRRHIRAALEHGLATRELEQCEPAARAGADLDARVVARRADEPRDVVDDRLRDVHELE